MLYNFLLLLLFPPFYLKPFYFPPTAAAAGACAAAAACGLVCEMASLYYEIFGFKVLLNGILLNRAAHFNVNKYKLTAWQNTVLMNFETCYEIK